MNHSTDISRKATNAENQKKLKNNWDDFFSGLVDLGKELGE